MRRALSLGLLSAPAVASACPVCFDAASGNVLHFYSISTAMLSLLPFGILAGIALAAYHLRRQAGAPPLDDAPDGVPARRV